MYTVCACSCLLYVICWWVTKLIGAVSWSLLDWLQLTCHNFKTKPEFQTHWERILSNSGVLAFHTILSYLYDWVQQVFSSDRGSQSNGGLEIELSSWVVPLIFSSKLLTMLANSSLFRSSSHHWFQLGHRTPALLVTTSHIIHKTVYILLWLPQDMLPLGFDQLC